MKTTARQRKLNIRYNDSIITETVGQRDADIATTSIHTGAADTTNELSAQ